MNCCLCTVLCQIACIKDDPKVHICIYCDNCEKWIKLADKVKRQRQKVRSLQNEFGVRHLRIENAEKRLHKLEDELEVFEGLA